jgi:hypothetical protein
MEDVARHATSFAAGAGDEKAVEYRERALQNATMA